MAGLDQFLLDVSSQEIYSLLSDIGIFNPEDSPKDQQT